MKSASKYLFSAAVAVLALTACSDEGNEPGASVSKDYPDFTATIGEHSRAFNESWENGDEIGISGAGRSNVCYVTAASDGNSEFTVKTEGDQIYFQDEKETTFTAYYPFTASLTDGAISADTKNQANQKKFDFLWTQGSGKKSASKVMLNFAHKMTKLELTVKRGKGMTFDEVKTARLSLNGFRHAGSFAVADGKTTVSAAITDNWAFTDAAAMAPAKVNEAEELITYTLIFFPQEFATPGTVVFLAELANNTQSLMAPIDFTAANRVLDKDVAKNQWVAGRQYNLSLTLHKTDITLDKCVINRWTEVNGGEIDVD